MFKCWSWLLLIVLWNGDIAAGLQQRQPQDGQSKGGVVMEIGGLAQLVSARSHSHDDNSDDKPLIHPMECPARIGTPSSMTSSTHRTSKDVRWHPRNVTQGNAFFLHHTHGNKEQGGRDEWIAEQSLKINALRKAKHVPRDVAFAFPNNGNDTPLVQKAYEKLGIPYYITARTYQPWDWWGKISPLKSAIMDGTIKEPYIVFTDAHDIMPQSQDFSGLKEAFQFYNASLVMGGYQNCWAAMAYPAEGEEACAFGKLVYPWSHYHTQAQAGFMMGRTKSVLKYLQELEEEFSSCRNFDDQAAWAILHMQRYPDIKIDTLTKLMSRIDKTRYSRVLLPMSHSQTPHA